MSGVVRCPLPFGMIGRGIYALKVRRDVERTFDCRFQRIEALFAGAGLAESN